jgi:iron complex outermembrane receptor protein
MEEQLDLWYTSDYDDRRTLGGGGPQTIDDYLTADLHYNLTFNDERTRIFASINNITDEDPPFARLDLSYDPYTHDPFGIIYKLGLQHRFEGGPFQ